MKKQGSGAIVNNSSIRGLIAGPSRSLYHAAKHGVLGLTKSATADYASSRMPWYWYHRNAHGSGHDQRRRLVPAGLYRLPPIKRLGKADQVVEAALRLFTLLPAMSSDNPFLLMVGQVFSNTPKLQKNETIGTNRLLHLSIKR